MIKENPTTGIYLDKRRPNKRGEFPVKLRITDQRRSKLYSTSYAFTIDEFDKIRSKSPRNGYKDFALKLSALEKHASDVLESLPEFSFEN